MTNPIVCGHYVDLIVQPDPEFGSAMLMSALFAKLHRALVAAEQATHSGSAGVGVGFPGHDDGVPTLGTHLRLHGSQAALAALMATPWLRGVRDHLADPAPPVRPVPDVVIGYRTVRRVQVDSNPERLRRRWLRRHPGMDDAAALQHIPDTLGQRLPLPFVQLNSLSTGQAFRLFVAHGPLQPQADAVENVRPHFNAYGLGVQSATIPWF